MKYHKITKPRAVLFDWDNTLADSWPVIYAALRATFEDMGKEPYTYDEVVYGRGGIHRSMRDSFPEIFGDRWEEARDIYYNYFQKKHLGEMALIEDAHLPLEELRARGVYMAVVSNKTGGYLRAEVEHSGLGRYFGKVIGAGDAKRDKPSPDPVHMALEDSGVENIDKMKNIWFIGDSRTDYDTSVAAGCLPVLFGRGEHVFTEGEDINAHHVRTHKELAMLVKEALSV